MVGWLSDGPMGFGLVWFGSGGCHLCPHAVHIYQVPALSLSLYTHWPWSDLFSLSVFYGVVIFLTALILVLVILSRILFP
jgi:hypothetical protein